MKLLRRYRSYTYTSLCLVILIGFLTNYMLFRYSNHRSADEVIMEYRYDIEDYAKEHGTLLPLLTVNSKFGHITQVDSEVAQKAGHEEIVDTLAYDHYQEEMNLYRKLVFPIHAEDGWYLVRLMLPTIDNDDLIMVIIVSLLMFIVLFILFTSVIDWVFSRHIFRPFNDILRALKMYDIEKRNQIELGIGRQNVAANEIDEFAELRRILKEMIQKINEGYLEMKEFLEYTSHELQTPLSVIQLKLEVLNQLNAENPELLECTESIQKSLKRAIRFNRSILLIAKIRNNQFAERKMINLRTLVEHFIDQYEEMLAMRDITLSYSVKEDFILCLHPLLAEQLVQNIMTNAIKHNRDGGSVCIRSTTQELVVTNTYRGEVPQGDLFEKYRCTAERRDSSGLGMAIAKTICEKNNMEISYKVDKETFTLRLGLPVKRTEGKLTHPLCHINKSCFNIKKS